MCLLNFVSLWLYLLENPTAVNAFGQRAPKGLLVPKDVTFLLKKKVLFPLSQNKRITLLINSQTHSK